MILNPLKHRNIDEHNLIKGWSTELRNIMLQNFMIIGTD